jgi:hypothetical protein
VPRSAESPEAISALRFRQQKLGVGLTLFAVIRTAVTAFHLDRPGNKAVLDAHGALGGCVSATDAGELVVRGPSRIH